MAGGGKRGEESEGGGGVGPAVKVTPLPKRVMTVVLIVQFAEAFQFCVLFPYVPFMVATFEGISPEHVGSFSGLVAASFSFGQLLSSFPWGMASDRFGEKMVVVISLLMTFISSVVFGLSRSFILVFLARFFGGLFNGNIGVIKTYLGKNTDSTNQTKAMGMVSGAWVIGSILAPAVGGLLAQPVSQYPGFFAEDGLFAEYPFILPSICTSVVLLLSLIAAIAFIDDPRYSAHWRRLTDTVQYAFSYCFGQRCAPQRRHFAKPGLKKTRSKGTYERIIIDSDVEVDLDDSEDEGRGGDAHALLPLGSPETEGNKKSFDAPEDGEGETPREGQPAAALEEDKEKLPLGAPMTPETRRNMLFTTFVYGVVCLLYVCLDETYPLFCRASPEEGGLGFSSKEIGISLSIMGIVDLLFIFTLFSFITARVSSMTLLRVSIVLMVPCLLVYPVINYLVLTSTTAVVWTVLLINLSARGILSTCVYTPVMAFINNSVPRHLMGRANGVGQTFAAATRGTGPAFAGLAWSLTSQATFPLHSSVIFLVTVGITLLLLALTWFCPRLIHLPYTERQAILKSEEERGAEEAGETSV